MIVFLRSLAATLAHSLTNFKILGQVLLFFSNLLAAAVTGSCLAKVKVVLPSTDEGTFELEVVKLQVDNDLRGKFR